MNFKLPKLKLNSLTSETDDELMSQIATGSSKAFQVLFERHGGLLLGYSKKLLGDSQRAEEASQDIWVKVVKLAPQYRAEGYFKAWIMRMMKNHCLNILRKDKRLVFKEEVGDMIDQNNNHDFEKTMLNRHNLKKVSEAIDSLPEKQRLAMTLVLIEEVSYEELAEELGASLGAVKSIVHRGRKALQEKLKEEV